MMVTRVLLCVMLIASLTLISDTGSNAAAPAAEKVYIVDSFQNQADVAPGDGFCVTSSGCTLRAAIQEANRDLSASKIKFSSKMTIVDPTLEVLSEPFTVIDASDRWDGDWPTGRPGVKIGGGLYGNGLLNIQGDYAAVYGIEFFGGGSKGIVVFGSDGTIIGGTDPRQRNAFTTSYHVSGTSMGIEVANNSSNTDIRSNYFGTFDGINAILNPGEYGVYLRSSDNTVRENIIVGHTMAGINIWIGGHNTIMENYIGTDEYQTTALPNQVGIAVYESDENQIGPYNYVYDNTQDGILVKNSDNNLVVGNDVRSNGGHGIDLWGANSTRVGLFIENVVSANSGHGIYIHFGGNNQVRFNSVSGNSQSGVALENTVNNAIGGVLEYERNVISNNGANGVRLSTGAHTNTVSGNYIGFGSSGAFDNGNASHGVLIENGASDNHIGGLDPGEGNWIGWNKASGIYITGSATTGSLVEGNVIGAPVNWAWEAPNGEHGIGIYDGANGNWIGWFNTILASGWSGVVVVNASNNVIWFNNIGTDGGDIHSGNNNYGIHIVNSLGNLVASNRVHHNGTGGGDAGVRVENPSSVNNFISLNSITLNGGLGIELYNGSNASQPPPTITSGSCTTTISGTTCPGCIVEIFSDGTDEGRFFEASATADASTGSFSWDGVPAGPNLTATASSAVLGSTSQFSAPYNIGICNNPPAAAFTFSPDNVNKCTTIGFDTSSSSDTEDALSVLQVRWDWENDGTYDTSLSYQKTAQHTFSTSGLHTVRLEVEDSGGLTDSTTRQVTISAETCGTIYLPIIIR
jgi:parallel beta-helix repeat protein